MKYRKIKELDQELVKKRKKVEKLQALKSRIKIEKDKIPSKSYHKLVEKETEDIKT